MRLTLVTSIALCLAGFFILSLPLHIRARGPEQQVVTFSEEGVSLTLKGRWMESELNSTKCAQPPKLTGSAGTIRAMLLPPDLKSPVRAAAGLEESLASRPNSVRRSALRDDFITATGLAGIHISFCQATGAEGESHSHHYLVKNRDGRCVAINFVGADRPDAEQGDQMIRHSLRWR
jgi:hypothetical protein